MDMRDPITVIGSGLAGYGVLRELRRLDKEVKLRLIAADRGDFYSKPMLSTALAKGKAAHELVTTPAARMAEQLALDLFADTRVEAIDRDAHMLETSAGRLGYGKLILALGADPIRLPLGGDGADDVLPINHLNDYVLFRDRLADCRHVAIIGAGLVGSEFANDLSAAGMKVTVIDPLPLPMATFLPPAAGTVLRDALAAQGVDWRLERSVGAVDRAGSGYALALSDGATVHADLVISAVGLRPHVALARAAGLETVRGIRVDGGGRTSDPDIWAIGDCAEYPIGVVNYITPIMGAARAIAAAALGNPGDIRFPVLSVVVKTTACPIALLRPPEGTAGSWIEEERDGDGLKLVYRDAEGRIAGYALTGAMAARRPDLDREIAGG